jgi:putative dehydrogenase
MPVKTVAILSPGDMGHAVGRALVDHGLEVITSLDGRSDRTRRLASEGNIQDVPDLKEMASRADLILSILVPSEAIGVARNVAGAIRGMASAPPFVDCNAVSPQSARVMSEIIGEAGGSFIDGSIIGGPPGRGASPRIYISGPWLQNHGRAGWQGD